MRESTRICEICTVWCMQVLHESAEYIQTLKECLMQRTPFNNGAWCDSITCAQMLDVSDVWFYTVRVVAFSVRAYMQKHLSQNLSIVYEVRFFCCHALLYLCPLWGWWNMWIAAVNLVIIASCVTNSCPRLPSRDESYPSKYSKEGKCQQKLWVEESRQRKNKPAETAALSCQE